jgi:cystathionine gamma-lyase
MTEHNPTLKRAASVLHRGKNALQPGDPVVAPIVPASVYFLPGEATPQHQYGRRSNPTWTSLEDALSIIEDAETVVFPSGMAAIASVFHGLLRSGDRILLPSDGYYTTRALAEKFLVPMGVMVETSRTVDYASRCFDGYRLVWIETPSNPGLDLCDLRAVTARARTAGALTVADNTTASALGQRPLHLGADMLVSSDTKSVSGHSDNLLGHVASRRSELMAAVREWRKLSGAIPGAFEAWLAHRGLESLEVRFDRMCVSAQTIAERLADHDKVVAVRHPGLANHPQHGIAKAQMLRFGFLLGITFASRQVADRFISECSFVRPVTSFGGVHTSAERRARWGDDVAEGYVRLSVGVEPTSVLWAEMARTLHTL